MSRGTGDQRYAPTYWHYKTVGASFAGPHNDIILEYCVAVRYKY